jgi:hypothetical protein
VKKPASLVTFYEKPDDFLTRLSLSSSHYVVAVGPKMPPVMAEPLSPDDRFQLINSIVVISSLTRLNSIVYHSRLWLSRFRFSKIRSY